MFVISRKQAEVTMKAKEEKKSPGIFKATFDVIKAAFSNVDESYEYKFPQRKMLHEKAPPHVQAVNQHLDKEGVDLAQEHVIHFERGFEIDGHEGEGYQHNMKKWAKTVKNERKIADSFQKEADEEAKKGVDADQTKITYAKAGYLAHTLFGSGKAAMNPYVSHEEGLGIGAIHDYIDFQQDLKHGMQ